MRHERLTIELEGKKAIKPEKTMPWLKQCSRKLILSQMIYWMY